jgi:hypothetical protein
LAAPDPDIFTNIEHFVFRSSLLIVFVLWLAKHVLVVVFGFVRFVRRHWQSLKLPDGQVVGPQKVIPKPSP